MTRADDVVTSEESPYILTDGDSSVPRQVAPESDVLIADAASQSESPPWGLTTKAIIASAVLILSAIVIWRFQFLISPLVLAAVIAYLVNPLVRWLQAKTNIDRGPAVLIVYLLFLLVVGGASTFLGVIIAQQSVRLWDSLPEFLPRMVDEVQRRVDSLASIQWTLGPYTLEPGAILDAIDFDRIAVEIGNSLQTILGRSGSWLANVAGATIGTLGDTILVLMVSIYLAIDGPRIGEAISETAGQSGYRQDARRIIAETLKVWNAYLRGQVILGLVIFVIVAVTLSILGVNNSLELGILSGVLEFLPVLGPVIGAVAAVIVALVQDGNPWGMSPWVFALVVLGAMIIIQQIENTLLVPRIVGDALSLHPVVVLVGVIAGTSLAGLLGAVLAAPVIATLKIIGIYIWRKMLDLPPFPEEPPGTESDAHHGGREGFGRFLHWFRAKPSRT
jgi:putative heme transporter